MSYSRVRPSMDGIRNDLASGFHPLGNGWPTYTVRFLVDEVDRLTAACQQKNGDCLRYAEARQESEARAHAAEQSLGEADAEIERLKARVTYWQRQDEENLAEIRRLKAPAARVEALADEWGCNCGGPDPEGQHEMHCDSYYGEVLRARLRGPQ